ncbi:MAG: dephospho-CoA kinase [Candidatus Midichloriaceae bacterium]
MRYKLNPRYGYLIGLTGNICTGKSLALATFKKMGFQTISMDKYVDDIMSIEISLKNKIAEKFPNALINGNISKKLLGNIVFLNKDAMNDLEKILTPYAKGKIQQISNEVHINRARSTVVEIPLLFEKKREQYFDIIIYLFSSTKTMLNRALKRKNMTENKFFAILDNQAPKKEVIHKVDYLIYNENRHYLLKSIKNIIHNDKFKRSNFRY